MGRGDGVFGEAETEGVVVGGGVRRWRDVLGRVERVVREEFG